MILSTDALTALLRATDKAIPEIGDNEVTVPQGLSLIHEPLLPLDYSQSSSNVQRGSFLTNHINTLGALAPADAANLATLAPGLWTIQINTWGQSNDYRNDGLFYTMTYQGSTIYLGGHSFYNGPFNSLLIYRFLLREQIQILKSWGGTAAATNAYMATVLTCTRHL